MVNKTKKTKSVSRVRLENDERRRNLLDLGISLFSKRAYDELSIDSIAELAGISKGLLYHYFPTKKKFYVETLRAASAQMLRLTEAPRSSSAALALRHGLDAYLDYVTENASVYVSLLRSGIGVDPEVASLVDEVRGTIIERMRGHAGIARPTARQELGFRGWIGFVEHATIHWLESRCTSREELRELLVGQFETMLSSVKALGASHQRRKSK